MRALFCTNQLLKIDILFVAMYIIIVIYHLLSVIKNVVVSFYVEEKLGPLSSPPKKDSPVFCMDICHKCYLLPNCYLPVSK